MAAAAFASFLLLLAMFGLYSTPLSTTWNVQYLIMINKHEQYYHSFIIFHTLYIKNYTSFTKSDQFDKVISSFSENSTKITLLGIIIYALLTKIYKFVDKAVGWKNIHTKIECDAKKERKIKEVKKYIHIYIYVNAKKQQYKNT